MKRCRKNAFSPARHGGIGRLSMLRIATVLTSTLVLAGCAAGSYCRDDDSGLAPPPKGSSIPEPHGGANAPSETIQKLSRSGPAPRAADDYRVPYIPPK
jgi:hypothetical protein